MEVWSRAQTGSKLYTLAGIKAGARQTQADKMTTQDANAPAPVPSAGAAALVFIPEYSTVSSDAEVPLTFNVRLQAPEIKDEGQQRAVVSLTSVLDKSGSMQGGKLGLVKRSSNFMLNQLSSSDKLGVVTYDSHVNEIIPLSRTTEGFKSQARSIISGIHAGSCTNLSGGLFKGIEQQVTNKYLDWEQAAERTTPPSPSAPSEAPSDTSSFVQVDVGDTASVVSNADSMASSAVDVGVLLQEQEQSGLRGVISGVSGFFGRMRGRGAQAPASRDQPPQALRSRGGGCPPQTSSPSYRCQRTGAPRGLRQTPPEKLELDHDAVRSVFLFTDGHANEGVTDKARLVSMVQKMVDAKHPVRVHTFGFGAEHCEDLLSSLAEAGSGNYYYIEKEENIPTAFADALGGLMSVSMQNITLSFVPAEGVVVDQVHTPFATSSDAGNGRSVCIGDLLSEESKDILMDVRLPALVQPAQGEIVDFKVGHLHVTYLDVASASIAQLQVDCLVKRSRQVAAAEPNRSVSVQRARMDLVKVLEESRAQADSGDYANSRRGLDACAQRLDALVESALSAGDAVSMGIAQVLRDDVQEAIEGTRTEHAWQCGGKKKMQMKIISRDKQRAVRADSEEDDEIIKLMAGFTDESSTFSKAPDLRAMQAVSAFRGGSKMQQNFRSLSKSSSNW